MSKLFLSENNFQKIKVNWSNGRLHNSLQKGNVQVLFTEVLKDSPEYKTEIPLAEMDQWSPIESQIRRQNFIANVLIDEKIAFSCTVADLFALQRALSIHTDRASAHIQ